MYDDELVTCRPGHCLLYFLPVQCLDVGITCKMGRYRGLQKHPFGCPSSELNSHPLGTSHDNQATRRSLHSHLVLYGWRRRATDNLNSSPDGHRRAANRLRNLVTTEYLPHKP